jgi:hypothetical protein
MIQAYGSPAAAPALTTAATTLTVALAPNSTHSPTIATTQIAASGATYCHWWGSKESTTADEAVTRTTNTAAEGRGCVRA